MAPSSETEGGADAVSTAPEASARGADAAPAFSEPIDAGSEGDGAFADAGPMCSALESTSLVSQVRVPSDPPPPLGGSIAEGTYVMTSAVEYTGDGGASGPMAGAYGLTIQITGSDWQFDENLGGVARVQHNDSLIASYDGGARPFLSLDPGCVWPQPGGASDYVLYYTATAEALVLYQTNVIPPTFVETLTKQ